MGKKEQPKKKVKDKYYPQLQLLITELGDWNVNVNKLSKEWGIPDSTLYRWKDEIVDEIGPLDLKEAGRNLQAAMVSNIKLCQRIIHTTTANTTKIQAMKAHIDLVKGFTDFLESYGYKQKIADKLEVEDTTDYDLAAAYKEYQNEQASGRRGKKKLTKGADKKA